MTMNFHCSIIDVGGHSISTWMLRPSDPRPDRLTLLLLHGAGQSHSGMYMELAEAFAHRGLGVVALDFAGYGKSGGQVTENSLSQRTVQALAAAKHWLAETVPLVVCGSSMAGHTALRVSAVLGQRVKSLALLQPAVYAAEAENLLFGPDFTRVIRQPNSWYSSLALVDASQFTGRSLIAIGTEDLVIPFEVIRALTSALEQSSEKFVRFNLEGVGHVLPTWLPTRGEVLTPMIDFLVDETSSDKRACEKCHD